MENVKNIGLIEENVAGQAFRLAGISKNGGYNLKKIMMGNNNSDNWVKQQFPRTEIVHDMQSILMDADIELVLVPAPQMEELNILAEILQTGKSVRIM